MKTYHEKLVAKAAEYIRRVHSDQSVALGADPGVVGDASRRVGCVYCWG